MPLPPATLDTIPISHRRASLILALVLLALASLPALVGAPGVSASGNDDTCSVSAAIPNDGRDDRVAIQNALTSQGCAHLVAGVYDIDSIPFTPPARRPVMMLDASGARLHGDGPGTVLAFRGSAGGADWEGIRLGGVGSSLHDLSINTGAVTDTVEQTHAVRLMGPATDAEISRVSFNHPHRATKSGDCVQLIGFADGREISRVRISENEFVHCDRSGVAVHSGTTQLEIADNRFDDIRNTDLDFEGSGDTSDVQIKHNTFDLSPGPHGVSAISLQLVERARIADNVFNGRGIDLFQSDDVVIDHNEITFTQATTEPVISILKDSARTHILDNSIAREPSAGVGLVISAQPHNSGTPDHLEIDGNALVQRTSDHVVYASGLVGVYVRHNAISYSGVANEMMGVFAIGSPGTLGIRTTDVHVDANTFSGPLLAAVYTGGSYAGAGTLDTSDNVAIDATYGIFCDEFFLQGGVLGPITSKRDNWPAPRCPADSVDVSWPPLEGEPRGGPPPGPDTTAPVLSGVRLSRTRRRTVLRFSSNEAGVLSIRIEPVRPGMKVRTATLTRAIQAGPGSIALPGPIGGKRMKPGSYRLTLAARDAVGNRSRPTRRTFAIRAD